MGSLLNRIKAAVSALRGNAPVFPGTAYTFGLGAPATNINYRSEIGDPLHNSIVAICFGWLSDSWREATPQVYKTKQSDGSESPVRDHRLLELLKNPNPFYSGELLREGMLQDVKFDGTAFAWIHRDRYGLPAQLYWCPADMVNPYYEQGEWIRRWEYTPNGQLIKIEPEDMLVWREGIDKATSGRRGFSRFRSVAGDVYSDNEARNTVNTILKRRAQMGVMVSPSERYFAELIKGGVKPYEAGYTAETAKELELKINQRNTGDNRGSTNVFSVPMQITEFGSILDKLDSEALRALPEERIAGIFKIPPVVVGLGSGLRHSSDKNNMETAQRQAWLNGVVPLQNSFAQVINEQLLPQLELKPETMRFGYDRSNVMALQESADAVAERARLLWEGNLVNHAEGREMVGLKPDTEKAKLYFVEFAPVEEPEEPQEEELSEDAKAWKEAYGAKSRARATA